MRKEFAEDSYYYICEAQLIIAIQSHGLWPIAFLSSVLHFSVAYEGTQLKHEEVMMKWDIMLFLHNIMKCSAITHKIGRIVNTVGCIELRTVCGR